MDHPPTQCSKDQMQVSHVDKDIDGGKVQHCSLKVNQSIRSTQPKLGLDLIDLRSSWYCLYSLINTESWKKTSVSWIAGEAFVLVRMSIITHEFFIHILTSVFLITGATPLNETNVGHQKNQHPMSFAWSLQPLMGLCGTLLNSFVLFMQYGERQTFIRPVNAMIWYVSELFSEL